MTDMLASDAVADLSGSCSSSTNHVALEPELALKPQLDDAMLQVCCGIFVFSTGPTLICHSVNP